MWNQWRGRFIFSGNSGAPPLLLKYAPEMPMKSAASGRAGRKKVSPRRHGGKSPRAYARKPAFSVTSVVQPSFLARDRAHAPGARIVKIDSQCQRAMRGRTIVAEARYADITPVRASLEIYARQRVRFLTAETGKISLLPQFVRHLFASPARQFLLRIAEPTTFHPRRESSDKLFWFL